MAEDKVADEQAEEEEGLSQAEKQAIIRRFEARIENGEFEGRPFHNVVKDELYPLLADGSLTEAEFSRLVRAWAQKNYPYDWEVRAFDRYT